VFTSAYHTPVHQHRLCLEQVANLLYAQANSASYPPWDGK